MTVTNDNYFELFDRLDTTGLPDAFLKFHADIAANVHPDRATVRTLQLLLEQAGADDAPAALKSLNDRAGDALRALAGAAPRE